MTSPAFEGFTQTPVVARTMRVDFPDQINIDQDSSSFWLDDINTVTPITPAAFEAESVDGETVHLAIGVPEKQILLTPGTWHVRFQAIAESVTTTSHRPNVTVVNGVTGTPRMLLLDSASATGVFSLSDKPTQLVLEGTYTSTDPIMAKLRVASEEAVNKSSLTRMSVTFTKLMSA